MGHVDRHVFFYIIMSSEKYNLDYNIDDDNVFLWGNFEKNTQKIELEIDNITKMDRRIVIF